MKTNEQNRIAQQIGIIEEHEIRRSMTEEKKTAKKRDKGE